jgi:hypothetical protein
LNSASLEFSIDLFLGGAYLIGDNSWFSSLHYQFCVHAIMLVALGSSREVSDISTHSLAMQTPT